MLYAMLSILNSELVSQNLKDHFDDAMQYRQLMYFLCKQKITIQFSKYAKVSVSNSWIWDPKLANFYKEMCITFPLKSNDLPNFCLNEKRNGKKRHMIRKFCNFGQKFLGHLRMYVNKLSVFNAFFSSLSHTRGCGFWKDKHGYPWRQKRAL